MQMGFFFFSVWLLGKLERRKDMLLNCQTVMICCLVG